MHLAVLLDRLMLDHLLDLYIDTCNDLLQPKGLLIHLACALLRSGNSILMIKSEARKCAETSSRATLELAIAFSISS